MIQARRGAVVVAGWFAGNAVLCAMLPAFGERPFAVALYAASTALPALFAVALFAWAGPNGDAEQTFGLGAHAVWTAPAAVGLVLIGVGTFAGVAAAWLGGVAVAVSVVQLLRGSRTRSPEVRDGRA